MKEKNSNEEDTLQYLLRYQENQYLSSFVNGVVHFTDLSKYRSMVDNEYIGDINEGAYNLDQSRFKEEIDKYKLEKSWFIDHNIIYPNVYSVSFLALSIDDFSLHTEGNHIHGNLKDSRIEEIQQNFLNDGVERQLIAIVNPETYLDSISKSVKNYFEKRHQSVIVLSRNIIYSSNPTESADNLYREEIQNDPELSKYADPVSMISFCKGTKYQNQSEYRIAIFPSQKITDFDGDIQLSNNDIKMSSLKKIESSENLGSVFSVDISAEGFEMC